MSNILKRIEYLESSGTQYIDTGITVNSTNLTVEIDGMFLNGDGNYIAGAYDGTYYYGLRPQSATTNDLLAWHPGGSKSVQFTQEYINIRANYNFINGDLYINDELKATGTGASLSKTLYLFARNGKDSVDALSTCRIYSCKIYQNGTLIRDFIPVLDTKGVPCLYDKVNSKLHYNLAQTLFSYDSYTGTEDDIVYTSAKGLYIGIDEDLQVVDFIESDGNQYIDTEVFTAPDVGFDITFNTRSSLNNTDFGTIIGGRISSSVNEINLSTFVGTVSTDPDTGTLRYGDKSYEPYLTPNTKLNCSLKNGVYTSPTGSITTLSYGVFNPIQYTLTLFALNQSGNITQFSKTKLFACKLYKGDEVIRDFVPVKDSTGKYCLYDRITQNKFMNKGTGEFTGGFINTELDYIESTGTQYIDTGIVPTNATKVIIDLQYTEVKYQEMGWGSSGNAEAFLWGTGTDANFHGTVNTTWTSAYADVASDTNRHTFELSSGSQKLDGVEFGTNTIGNTAVSGQTLYLFAGHVEYQDEVLGPSSARIYSCKIYSGESLVRDYVPMSDENGNYYLLDKVNNTIYKNIGTGTFLGGSSVTSSEIITLKNKARKVNKIYVGKSEELQLVDYIESSGNGYIDTGIIPNNNLTTEIIYSYTAEMENSDGVRTVCGAYGSNNNRYIPATSWGSYTSHHMGVAPDGTQIIYQQNFDTAPHKLIYNDAEGKIYFDDNFIQDFGGVTDSYIQKTLTLFAYNTDSDGIISYGNYIRIYSCKLIDKTTNTVLRDLVPIKRTNGEYYMYDKITNKLLQNKGTGKFIGGEPTTEKIDLGSKARKVIKGYIGVKRTLQVLDYIESTGVQYIDTNYIPNNATRVKMSFEFTKTHTSHSWLFGARKGYLDDDFSMAWHIGANEFYDAFDTNLQYISSCQANVLYEIDKNRNVTTINDTSKTNTSSTFECGMTMFLFALATNTGPYGNASLKIYSTKIYDNDVLVRDYIPVKDENGIVCLYDKISKKLFYNKGTGSFIAGEETGDTIIKSTARVFFTNNKILKSLGLVATKQYSLYGGGIASTQDYFIMAGGQTTEGGSAQTSGSEAYDLDFVRKAITGISPARRNVSGGSIGGYALFLGGYTGSSTSYSACSKTVEAYDNSLTKKNITSLTSQQHLASVAFNERHLMVFGAAQYSQTGKTVDSYDTNLVKTQCTDLASNRKSLGYTRCGNYLMAAGGSSSSTASGGQVTTVEAYSNDLVKTTCTGIDTAVHHPSGGWVNGFAMIVGGSQTSESGVPINTMNIYDENLTKRTSIKFPVAANDISKTTIANGKYAIFGSGRMGSGGSYTYPSTHYIYDEDLVLIKTIENCGFAGNVQRWMATIGDMACRYNYGSGVGAIGLVEEE